MRQEIPNSSCGYRIDGPCMDTCRAHRCVKKAHASFFPSSLSISPLVVVVLDEIHAAQTDCFADDYIRNFNKAQRVGILLYIIFLKSPRNYVHMKWEIF